jgi:hypothetical protein
VPKKKLPKPPRKKHLLNDRVALIEGEVDESRQNFKISFDHYKSNLCEIDDLEVSSARKCLTKLKQFGQSNHKTLFENNIRSTPIKRSGSYKALFSKLSDDVDLFEIDIGQSSRLFYFIFESLICIVAIKNSHFKY